MKTFSSQPSRPPSKPRAVFVLGSLIAAFAMMACSLFSKPASLIDKTGAMLTAEVGKISSTLDAGGSVTGETTPTPAVTAEALIPQTALPRSFKYNDLTFDLQKAVITNQPPEGANLDAQSGAYAQTVWKVTNPTTSTRYVRQGVFTLELGNGKKATRPYDAIYESQDTKDVTIVFNVPADATWDGAKITFTEPDKEPAALPLFGEAPEAKYPQKLAANGQAQVSVPALIYQIQEASVDLDGMGQRADAGKRFLLFKVQATCKEKYDCYVGPESFRVLADGTPYSAAQMDPAADAVSADGSKVFRLAFQIPDGAQQVELQVGEAGKDTQKIPINLGGAQ